MSSDTVYAINESKAISETLEGETVIINLENGNYYSLNQAGSVLWGCLLAGNSIEQVRAHFSDRYDGAHGDIEKSVGELVSFLRDEGLIVPAAIPAAAVLEAWTSPKETFIAPAIVRYDDMQEMLLADPIHDVDEAGWPSLKK